MAEFQAGGTDVQDRLRRGAVRDGVTPLPATIASTRIEWQNECATIGALVRVATVAHDPKIIAAYPGLAAAAGGLATPQIRAVATVGGALLQRTRCWYFRDPEVSCFKSGGTACPARDGDHTFGVCFDWSACVWPHPSTLGAALLAYDATVTCAPGGTITTADLFGDGVDPTRDHTIADGQVLTHVTLGPPVPGERAAYVRIIGRKLAEWPLVEAVVRLVIDGDRIAFARIGLGGVATVPMRLTDLERALVGVAADSSKIRAMAIEAVRALCETSRIPTLPATRYKLELIPVAIADAAAQALAPAASSAAAAQAPWALPWIAE